MADEKTIYKMKTPSGDPVRVEEAWKDANGELLTEKVNKADAQTITGLKTFSTLPQSSATPSDDKDLATKKYSDDLWATRKAQEEKCYQALKTVTKDFTRTDPVYVRIGEDGEPEIHYTVASSKNGSFYFKGMNLGNAKLIFRNFNKFTDITYIFNNSVCKTVEIDSINVTDMTAFNMCAWASRDGVQSINAFDTSKVTSWNSAFYWNRGIKEIPAFDMSAATDLYHVFYEAINITAVHCTGMKVSFDLSYCTKMSRDALLEVFNNLADLTGKDQATLTIGSTLGAKITDEDRAIVTGKNWNLAE